VLIKTKRQGAGAPHAGSIARASWSHASAKLQHNGGQVEAGAETNQCEELVGSVVVHIQPRLRIVEAPRTASACCKRACHLHPTCCLRGGGNSTACRPQLPAHHAWTSPRSPQPNTTPRHASQPQRSPHLASSVVDHSGSVERKLVLLLWRVAVAHLLRVGDEVGDSPAAPPTRAAPPARVDCLDLPDSRASDAQRAAVHLDCQRPRRV
jgi:hypothetical protein